jgi:hypothetical protein
MLEPEKPRPNSQANVHSELDRVVLKVGWVSPFLLIEYAGERFFRSARQGNHLTTLVGFKDELEERGLKGEPHLVEAGMIRKTEDGVRLFEGYGGSTEENPDSREILQSVAFLRQHCPDIILDNDV